MSEPIRLRIPMPFAIDHVNAYLIPGEPLTLVDPGPLTDVTLAGLELALAGRGARIEDVELLILTHEHEDHIGLAATVAERSGCAVAAPSALADMLRDLDAIGVAEDAYRESVMLLHGGPPEEVARLQEVSAFASAFTESVEVTMPLGDCQTVTAGGRELTAHLRPGHTPTDMILVDGDGWALVADHLPARGRTLVVARRPPHAAGPRDRPQGLLRYRESLAKTEALGLHRAFPGHGSRVGDPTAAIARQLELQAERARQILSQLGAGPRTAWELVESVRTGPSDGDHLVSEGYILLSDVLAHLDLLVAEGHARVLDGEVIRYERCHEHSVDPDS